MTNTFFDKTKQILSEFLAETRESLDWAATEVRKQFYISVLKGLTKEYPVTALKTNSLLYFLDHKNYKLEEMQFGMVPDPLYDAIKAIKNPEKDCPDFVEPPERVNSIIVWDSAFSNTVYSVGVVLAKEGDSYRILDYIRDKLEIIGQLQEIRNFVSKYPEAKVGIVPQANGAAILRLLQSEFPDIVEAKLALGDRAKLGQAIMERKLLTVPPSFNEFDEWKRIVNWGIGYLAIDSLTNVDLTDLKEGDRLTNRWDNDSTFETEAETDDGLNEPRYPYDNEPSS
jgi:hypothetical protein